MAKKILIQLLLGFALIPYIHGQRRVVVNDGLGTVIETRGGKFDLHETTMVSDLISVKIRCRNDQTQGLVCSADYPDSCKEQWNFPNPCTQYNIDMNVTKFVHPYDKTRFLMCGQLGKLYIVQCPQYEVFSERCGQCVGQDAGLIGSCSELPLPPIHNNPCTREAILQNKLFFPFHGNLSMFIHCDIWGKPWERICTPGEVWSVWDVTCVLPHLLNPCNRPTTDINYLYGHPCDPAKYLTCDIQGRAHEINCASGEAFHEENQRCRPYKDFKDRILSSYCEHYVFGFRQNQGNDGTVIQGGGIGVSGGVISGLTGQGFQRDNTGLKIDRTIRNVDGSATTPRDSSGQGLKANLDLRGGSLKRETNLQGLGGGTAAFDRTTQVRGGSLPGQIRTAGQVHFGGRLDVKGGSVSGGSRGASVQGSSEQSFTSGATRNFIDLGAGLSDFTTDIRNQGSGSNHVVDVRKGQTTGTENKVDITGLEPRTLNEGVVDTSGQLSSGFANTRVTTTETGTQPGTLDGGMVDKIDQGRGASNSGFTDNHRFRTDVSGTQTGTSPGDIVDKRNIGSLSGGTVDIGGTKNSLSSNLVDTRKGAVDRRFVDLSGSTVDMNVQGSGTSSSNMMDLRGRKANFTNSKVDIHGVSSGGGSIDISGSKREKAGGMVDNTGATGNGMASIRGGSGSMTTIDNRGARQGTLDGIGVIVDPVTGQDQVSWLGRSGQGLTRTSSGQLTGIERKQQKQSPVTTGNQSGIGSISSFDLRNELGLNGQTGTGNVDSAGRINTDSIRIKGFVQGGRQKGGSMNELLNGWNQIVETGTAITGQGTLSQTGTSQTGQTFGTTKTIHPSRLGLYDISNGYFVPPCTRKNIEEGRTHFRHKGFPHEFIQCDQSGKMHRMKCHNTHWFDVYTNTCVDGPVHVDNQVQ